MTEQKSPGGNRLVAIGLLLLTYFGVYWKSYPEADKLPFVDIPLVIPYVEVSVHFAMVGAAAGMAFVIIGFWRGW